MVYSIKKEVNIDSVKKEENIAFLLACTNNQIKWWQHYINHRKSKGKYNKHHYKC